MNIALQLATSKRPNNKEIQNKMKLDAIITMLTKKIKKLNWVVSIETTGTAKNNKDKRWTKLKK